MYGFCHVKCPHMYICVYACMCVCVCVCFIWGKCICFCCVPSLIVSCIIIILGIAPTRTNNLWSFRKGFKICLQYSYLTLKTLNMILVDCGEPPVLINATVTAGETIEGTVRNYTCVDGHGVIAGSSLTSACLANGTWTEIVSDCRLSKLHTCTYMFNCTLPFERN